MSLPSMLTMEPAQSPVALELSVMIPAFNECQAIAGVIHEIREALEHWPGSWELLVIDDGSTDDTADVAEAHGARVVRRPQNGGYGRAIRTGLLAAHGQTIAIMDGDGTYSADELLGLLAYVPEYDQVNGARRREQGTLPWLRVPAKWLLRRLAEVVSGRKIPDLNTGMKVFKRDVALRYLWALPEGFSCSTTLSLAFLCNGHPVKYIPVDYRVRKGRSKFRPGRDTIAYGATILRVIMYFRPLRVFVPLALSLGALGLLKSCWDVLRSPTGVGDSDVIMLMAAIIIMAVGMLADIIVAQRRN